MDFSGFTADSHQEANTAGLLRVWKILSKSFTSEFPTKANTITGEIAQNIVSSLPAFFVPAEYVVPNKSASFEDTFQNDIGFNSFSHMIDFELAGFSKEIIAEIMKDMNAGAVFIVETADETLAVLGTSKKGLIPSSSGKSGKAGTDKRGRVHKSENSGYRWPILPLSSSNKTLFLNRIKGYDDITYDRVTGVTVTWGTSHTFTVYDEKAFLVGDRIKIRMYGINWANSPWLAWGTISNITAGPSSDLRSIVIQLDPKPAAVAAGNYSSIRYYTLYTMATDVKNTKGATLVTYEEFV